MLKPHVASGITRTIAAFGTGVLDFIYPPFCSVCASRLQGAEELVCEACWRDMPRIPGHLYENTFSGIERWWSVWEYSDVFQQLVHEMKFFRKKSLAHKMAEEMWRVLSSDPVMSHADLLIPVPLHRVRLRERGFNQSMLLAQGISEKSGIRVDENLRRIRMTQPQSKLGSEARQRNVEGAFAVPGHRRLRNKNVILVDDVTTTGSTLSACASVLRQAGAARVFAVTAGKTL